MYKKKILIKVLYVLVILFSNLFSQDDPCSLSTNTIFISDNSDIWYNVNQNIYGFQFVVEGATVESASGGDAENVGFTIQGMGTTVLGFSFSGSYVEAGCGTLVELSLNGNATSLTDIVFSDASAADFGVTYWSGTTCDDLDLDEICDNIDICPNDPLNDFDNDGFCADEDSCPNDPNNDSDNDGLCADVDPCPNDGENDIDDDGLCASEDPCPEDYLNDQDEDGICDGVDDCIGSFDICGVCNGDNLSCAQVANHLIISRVAVSPNQSEMVEIHNPTNSRIYLNDTELGSYYLTDSSMNQVQGKYYYNLPFYGPPYNLSPWNQSYSEDFFIEFPFGSFIDPGETKSISMHDPDSFYEYYERNSDFSLSEILPEYFYEMETDNGNGFNILDDDHEVLILFYWDKESEIIKDVDYLLWGDAQYAINKTNVLHPDTNEPLYQPDTPSGEQNYLEVTPDDHYSYFRVSNIEYGEKTELGNGLNAHDETSEMMEHSWIIDKNPERIFNYGCMDESYGHACEHDTQILCSDDTTCDQLLTGSKCIRIGNYDSEATVSYNSCAIFDSTIEEILSGDVSPGEVRTVSGQMVSFTQTSGPWVIKLRDHNNFEVEVIGYWDIQNSIISYLSDPYNYVNYIISATGSVDQYPPVTGKYQLETTSDFHLDDYIRYYVNGEFIDDEDVIISTAEIVVAPYVVIPTLGERINFMYSFPDESRVIIRIFSLDGRLITSLVDKYYPSSGTVIRSEDQSNWDGKDHLGQIVSPGTYLIHIEASNFKTGKTSTDVAPIVIGVPY